MNNSAVQAIALPAAQKLGDCRAVAATNVRDLADVVGTGAVLLREVLLLRERELGFAAAELVGGLATAMPLRGASADRVGFELGYHAEDVEQKPADRVASARRPLPQRFRATPFFVSSFAMSVASRRDRARRSSFATTRMSPVRHAPSASRRPGRARGVPERAWSTCTW